MSGQLCFALSTVFTFGFHDSLPSLPSRLRRNCFGGGFCPVLDFPRSPSPLVLPPDHACLGE
jgi:hypothetical protein